MPIAFPSRGRESTLGRSPQRGSDRLYPAQSAMVILPSPEIKFRPIMTSNPFFEDWKTPFAAPPFDRIAPEHFRPAYDRAIAEHAGEIARDRERPKPRRPSRTRSWRWKTAADLLRKVEAVFGNLAASHTNDAIAGDRARHGAGPRQALERRSISNAKLFTRIDALQRADARLDAESLRVLERYHLDFVRAGAKLEGATGVRARRHHRGTGQLGTISGRTCSPTSRPIVLPLERKRSRRRAAISRARRRPETAKERGLDAPFAVTTSRSSVEPILQFADNRELREKIFKAWTARGDNRQCAQQSRADRARW